MVLGHVGIGCDLEHVAKPFGGGLKVPLRGIRSTQPVLSGSTPSTASRDTLERLEKHRGSLDWPSKP